MKKIKTAALSSLLVSGILLGGLGTAHAEVVNGQDSANITVNGSLGQDNTDENAPNIDDGSKDWINVTLDTANIFYTTKASDHKTITSPAYTITNNSGRAVKVSATNFTVDSGNLTNVDDLKIEANDAEGTAQSVDLKTFASGDFLKLANKNGKLNVETDAENAHANTTSYKYIGTTTGTYYKTTQEQTKHKLTLSFEALGKDGNSVTP